MASVKPESQGMHFNDDAENYSSNPSNNREFSDVLQATVSRRNMIVGTLAAAGATFLTPAPAQAFGYGGLKPKKKKGPLVDFAPLTAEQAILDSRTVIKDGQKVGPAGRTLTVSSDYEYQTIIPWGTPLYPGIPEYKGEATRPKSSDAEKQVGIGHDGMWFFPGNLPRILKIEANRGRELPAHLRNKLLWDRYGIMCINHEFGNNFHVLGRAAPESLEDVRLSQAVHGVSVVALFQSRSGKWRHVPSKYNRRITVNTPIAFSGPVAGTEYLENEAANEPAGTLNNCGMGPTPWGTYLTCEENFNAYFGANKPGYVEPDPLRAEGLNRYSFRSTGTFGNYQWWVYDPRFDYSNPDYKNEINRFGWCVEVFPFAEKLKAVKRTAMGRVKHEAAAFLPEKFDKRAVCYMGDDQRGDYCYKFVSDAPWRKHLKRGQSPLDHGKLYVAKFNDGLASLEGTSTGEWLELTIENPLLAAKFNDQAELLTYTRLAADILGATKMDRPEWTTIGKDGEVYWTLTNNDRKDDGAGALGDANPIFENRDGHIIKTQDLDDKNFVWSIFILARNTRPTNPGFDTDDLDFAAYSSPADGGANTFTDPDAVWADPHNRLFVGTDGGQPDTEFDRLDEDGVPLDEDGNPAAATGKPVDKEPYEDQLVVFDPTTGEYKRLLMGVRNDEITGITTTPDYKTMFTNTQHPGDGDPSRTNFPAPFDGVTVPRDCTIVLRRKDGGIVGS